MVPRLAEEAPSRHPCWPAGDRSSFFCPDQIRHRSVTQKNAAIERVWLAETHSHACQITGGDKKKTAWNFKFEVYRAADQAKAGQMEEGFC